MENIESQVQPVAVQPVAEQPVQPDMSKPAIKKPKKWLILIVVLAAVLLAVALISMYQNKKMAPVANNPLSIPSQIKPSPSPIHLPIYQGIIKSISPDSLTIEASGSAITSKINKLNHVFKFISGPPKDRVASASASELKAGQEVYVTVNINSEITSITILK